jgi:hypothetical protein
MFPPAPHQSAPTSPAGPLGAGPAGLDDAVSKMFAPKTPGVPTMPNDVYTNLDRKALLKLFQDAKVDGQELRWTFERQWWRDLLYVLGRQWVFFDNKRNEWRDKRLKKWVPKPVTNKMREVQNTIRAMFASVALGVISRPNGNDPKNIATANTVDGLQPLIHAEHKMDARMRLADFWATNLGCVFLYPWWNPDDGEVKPIQHDQCQSCGETQDPATMDPVNPTCPTCDAIPPVVDPATGMEIPNPPAQFAPVTVGHAPTGRGCTDVVSPFEILLPSVASNFEEVEWVIRVRWRTKAYIEAKYPELAPSLRFEKQTGERSLHMFKALAAQNDMTTTPFTMGGAQRGQSEGITEYEYWQKPNKVYARGLFFRVLGDKAEQILEDPEESSPGPIPTVTIKDEPIWPWIQYSYEEFGGRLFASGAISPLIQKQDQLNQLDAMTQLAVQRMGNPIWLEPKGTDVERFTGEPGLVVKYNMLGTTGQGKPERIPGEPIPASTFQLREQYLQDIEEMAGTYDVLKGAKPAGVEAFSALQLLVERSQSRFTTAFGLRGEAYQDWFRVALELERKYGPTQRTLSLLGPNGTWTFQTFEQADLLGDVSIVVEDGTNVPKTALGKRAAMEQANNLGMVDPNDPDTKYAFLSDQGLYSLMPGLDSAKKAALRQQDAFEQWAGQGMQGPPPLKIQPWDDPAIMINELKKWANSDKMQSLLNDPGMGPMITEILTMFYQALQQMMQPVIDPATGQALDPNTGAPVAGGGAPQPGHAPGGGQAMSSSNRNSSKTHIVDKGQPTAPVKAA